MSQVLHVAANATGQGAFGVRERAAARKLHWGHGHSENFVTHAPRIVSSLFQQAVEQADIAISITDAAANILYVNPAFTRATGYGPEELVGANQSLLSNKTTPAKVYKAMWAKIASGRPWSGRLVNRRKDGSEYLADLLITPVVDGAGAIVNYVGIHRDVTAFHRLECEVANQKALIESVVDAAPVVLALLDGAEKVVLDNHEYKTLMGDLRMAEPATAILAAVRADMAQGFAAPQENGPAFSEREIRIDAAGAPRWFSCSGTWVRRRNGGADAFFARGNDLYLLLVAKETTKSRAEQERARMAALQALMAEEARVDALRETLTAAVFQIEGPLNLMSSAIATLARRGGGDAAGSVLAEAVSAGKAAVENLRSAIPEHDLESQTAVNLNEVLRDVLDITTRRMLAAGIGVHWRPQAVLPSVNGQVNRLRAMFKALVDNAIEAMNTKGWRERELRVTTRGHDGSVEILVEDSGPGIPADLRLKVFEPFFSTRKAGGHHVGTGLSSAQQVAADHDGVIEIDPAELGGCRVRVVLPAYRKGEKS
ncbi:MAG: nitrogen fixation negative regulator NifL [Rhodocyclales bacterium]|nr:nitrogen fixation negative regulator NifL [Rhodocyclales bacterium]